jgi:hypothetical protein
MEARISFKPGTSQEYKDWWYEKHGLAPAGKKEGVEKPSPKSDKQKTKKGRKGGN